jgi:uncharacterized repeat protein (TIGR04052 family)
MAALALAGLVLPIATAQTQMQTVAIRFKAMVGDQVFTCGESYTGIGTMSSTVTPSDFRFYVSEVLLIGADGSAVPVALDQDGRWQYRSVALLDFENKAGPCANGTEEIRDVVLGAVPSGNYTGLRYVLGVPFGLSHDDATIAPSPLNLTSLFWTWQSGYKFLRIDMMTGANGMISGGQAAGAAGSGQHAAGAAAAQGPAGHGPNEGFVIHLGSTGCTSAGASQPPTECANSNRPTIELARFDSASNVVVADLKALLAGTNVEVNQPDTDPGCMSSPDDDDCAAIFANLGLPFNWAPAGSQTFFRVQ